MSSGVLESNFTGNVRHIETHISHVFITNKYAYKLKKPINYDFADFSTLSKRKNACMEEIRLNSRMEPDIYKRVLCVYKKNGQYTVGSNGNEKDIIDYLVKMIKLPDDGMLINVIRFGKLTSKYVEDTASKIAKFHSKVEKGGGLSQFATVTEIQKLVKQNFEQTYPYVGETLSQRQYDLLKEYFNHFLEKNIPLFDKRIVTNNIVDGHGDIHIGNICVVDTNIVIFDCIEFNQAFRAGDTISDIAFLAMDFDQHGLSSESNQLLNTYLELTMDYEGVELLMFYLIYRAFVRGKVISFMLDNLRCEQRNNLIIEAKRYFDLANHYLSCKSFGMIITCGISGSGKSHIAKYLASHLGGFIIRSDAVRKYKSQDKSSTIQNYKEREDLYEKENNDKIYNKILDYAKHIIKSNRWAILDATFLLRVQREKVAKYAAINECPFIIVYCNTKLELARNRVYFRSINKLDISEAYPLLVKEQKTILEPPASEEGSIIEWDGESNMDDLLAQINAVTSVSQ